MSHEDRSKEESEGETLNFSSPETVSADILLERKSDPGYIIEWTAFLQEQRIVVTQTNDTSIVVFRLGCEWLGMSTLIFNEVSERRAIHTIPHRKSPYLMGLTNFRGQLRLCVNLHNLLEIGSVKAEDEKGVALTYSRMLSIQNEGDFWIFPVDEVRGIFRFDLSKMENVPVTVSKSTANYIKGVLSWSDITIGVLDEELLLYSMKRSLS